MRYTDADLTFLARVAGAGDSHATTEYLRAWRADPSSAEPWCDDERVLAALLADDRGIVELSPRFLFGVLLRRIRNDLATIPYTVERPSPVPFPASLVVKNGSKRRERVFSSIPWPVSLTARTTWGPRAPLPLPLAPNVTSATFIRSKASRPPSGMASNALRMRLMKTC